MIEIRRVFHVALGFVQNGDAKNSCVLLLSLNVTLGNNTAYYLYSADRTPSKQETLTQCQCWHYVDIGSTSLERFLSHNLH